MFLSTINFRRAFLFLVQFRVSIWSLFQVYFDSISILFRCIPFPAKRFAAKALLQTSSDFFRLLQTWTRWTEDEPNKRVRYNSKWPIRNTHIVLFCVLFDCLRTLFSGLNLLQWRRAPGKDTCHDTLHSNRVTLLVMQLDSTLSDQFRRKVHNVNTLPNLSDLKVVLNSWNFQICVRPFESFWEHLRRHLLSDCRPILLFRFQSFDPKVLTPKFRNL